MNVNAASLLSSVVTREMADLNTSDHLPIVVSLDKCKSDAVNLAEDLGKRVSWGSLDDTSVGKFVNEVSSLLNPLLNNGYSDVEEVGAEIEYVSKGLVECGFSTLPLVSGRKKKVWKDKQLSDLCEGSWQARKLRVEAGRPQGGPLYDEKCRLMA